MPIVARSALPWFEDTPAKDIHTIMTLGDVTLDGRGGDDQAFEVDGREGGFTPDPSNDDTQAFEDI